MAETAIGIPRTLGHPQGLYILFFTEMWERFSYYGMRALLFLYLTKHFLLNDDAAYGIFGAYTALVYASPVLGGLIADRYLGYRKAVILGAVLLVMGHTGMAWEGVKAVEETTATGTRIVRDDVAMQILYVSLALIATGVGFLKANISTIVGTLYEQGDRRRDSGFTIFYMGINTGALLGPLACGYLGEVYGWRFGFGLAGVGMLAGLLVFIFGKKSFGGRGGPPDPARLDKPLLFGLKLEPSIYLIAVLMILASWQLLQVQEAVMSYGLGAAMILVAGSIVLYSILYCTPTERSRHFVALTLMFFSIVFWSLFEQAGSSLTAFADRVVDRTVFGMEAQTSQLQSLNPLFIILLAPLFSAMWIALDRRRLAPSTPTKFALGILQAGLGFFVLVYGAEQAAQGEKVALIWLALAYFLHTTGELCLSPVGLSAMTKLSVPALGGTIMGAWFLSSSAASYIAARVAQFTAMETVGGEITDISAATALFTELFSSLAWLAVGVAAVVFLLSPILTRGMRGAD